MATTPDPYTVLTAVADHIHTNPMLADTVTSVAPNRGHVQIYPTGRTGPRRGFVLLAEWIGSLYDVAPAIVSTAPADVDTGRAHLDLRCQLHDGTTVTLIVVLNREEAALLSASVLEGLRAGDAVPIELLLRLADGWNATTEEVASEPVVERVPDQVGETFRTEEFVGEKLADTGTVPTEEPTL